MGQNRADFTKNESRADLKLRLLKITFSNRSLFLKILKGLKQAIFDFRTPKMAENCRLVPPIGRTPNENPGGLFEEIR